MIDLAIKQAFRQILEMPSDKNLTQARQLRSILKNLAEAELEVGYQTAQETVGDWLEPSDYNEGYD